MPRLALAALLLASLSLTACDNQRSDLFGEFIADVFVDGVLEQNPDDEGDDDARDGLEGEAVYTVVQTAHGPEVVIGLFVGDLFDSQYDDYQYVLFRLRGDGPAVGAYAIDDDPEYSAAKAIYADVQEPEDDDEEEGADEFGDAFVGEILTGTDGVLAISYVDQYSVRGTFRFDARGIDVRDPERFLTGEASGRFEAVYERPSLVLNRGLDLR